MAKGDWAEVALKVGDSQGLFRVDAKSAGQKVKVDWVTLNKLTRLRVSLLTRNDNPIETHEFSEDVVLRASSKVKAE